MGRKVNLTGLQINDWLVLHEGEKIGSKHTRWICKCKCGRIFPVTYQNLVRKTSKKCKFCGDTNRKYREQRGEVNHRWNGYKEITGVYFGDIRKHAKKRKLDFLITKEYIWNLFIEQNKKCALSKINIQFGKYQTASLDRIDSSKGYVVGNVQWLHKKVNIMKQAMKQKSFIQWCRIIAESNNDNK